MKPPALSNRIRPGILALLLVLILGSIVTPALGQNESAGEVEIIFFWGNGCPHCAQAEPFLKDLQSRYPYVKISDSEVWYHPENQPLYNQMADKYEVPEGGRGVPFIILGDQYWMGYTEAIGQQIEAAVKGEGEKLAEQ